MLAIASGAGFVAVAGPAHAAGPWYVAASPTGVNNTSCGLAPATPCATVTYVLGSRPSASGDTINVANGVYTDRPVVNKAVTIAGASTAGTIFDGGNLGTASAMAFTAVGNTALKNVTLRNGFNNSTFGGGLRVQAGFLTASDVNLTGNSSTAGGGAIVYGGATLTMTGGTVANNTSTATAALLGAGAGIYVVGKQGGTAEGNLTINGTTFTNNVATGGALAAAGNGGAIFNAGTTTVSGATFSKNQAVASTNTNPRRGQGGAIFNGPQDADDVPQLAVLSSSLSGGLAAGSYNASTGGAIANAESLGGPVPTLAVIGSSFSGFNALLGGAVYNAGSMPVFGSGSTFTGNTAFSGGALYQQALVVPAAVPTSTIDGATFTSNTADGGAAANYGNGGAIFNTSTITLKNSSFTGNTAKASSAASTATGWGGAIYNGAFAVNQAPALTVSNTSASGGNASVAGAIANPGNVFNLSGVSPSKLTATGLTLSNNVAGITGGLYTGGPTALTDSTVSGNKATHASLGFGGGILTQKSGAAPTVTLDNTDVTGNSATVLGGGIGVLGGTTVELENGSAVNGNQSAVSAGGVYNAGALRVSGSSVSDNDAAFQGGGIYSGSSNAADTPSVLATGASVDGNTAANAGGGLLTLANATASFTGGHLDDNSALAGGGAYVGDNAPASFDGTDLTGNTATSLGGGALLNSGTTTINGSSLTGNHAIHTTGNTGLGGAIYSGSNTAGANTSLKITKSAIADNDAYAAAAILTYSPGDGATNKTSVDSSTISGNASSSAYGAIEQFHPMTITSSTITANTATDPNVANVAGGLAMFAPAQVGVAGTILAGNSGLDCSGSLNDGGYNLGDDTSCGFTPAKHDVAGNPQLGPLANNGGPTRTHLPSATSPALDQVPATTATVLSDAVSGNAVTLCGGAQDQRGSARPAGAKCDIGSVEKAQDAPTVDGPVSADYAVGVAGAPLTYTSAGSPQPSLSAAGLPAGVTFTDHHDGTGTVGGTPAADTGGSYAVTVTATNEADTDTTTLTLKVHQAPVISGPAAATYRVGQAGGPTTFTQTKGYPTATLSSTGSLPGGVSFADHGDGSGAYSGTPDDGTGGVYPLTVKGANGTAPDASAGFQLTVEEAAELDGPSTATFTVGASGSSGEYVASGFPVPTLSAAGLPGGLALTGTGPGTAKLTGTPANGTGGVYDVVVTAANGIDGNATKHTELTVNEAPEITGPSSVRFVAGHAGTTAFSADGYPSASLELTGDLPDGVTFTDNGNGSATLEGTAPASEIGSYELTLTASNGVDPNAVLHVTLEIAPPVQITTTSLPDPSVGTAYGATVAVSGGAAPYTFSLDSGTLPAGLSLNAATGTISGTPTGPAATSSFTVRVTDSSDPAETDTQALSITVGKGTSTLAVEPVVLQVTTQLGIKVNLALLEATLTGGTPAHPLAGRTIVFKAGSTTVCTANTDVNGHVRCQPSVTNTLLVILNLGVTATWAGDTSWNAATGSAGLLGN